MANIANSFVFTGSRSAGVSGKCFLAKITLMILGVVIRTFGKPFIAGAAVTDMILVRIDMSESRNVAIYYFCRSILANTHHEYLALLFARRF